MCHLSLQAGNLRSNGSNRGQKIISSFKGLNGAQFGRPMENMVITLSERWQRRIVYY